MTTIGVVICFLFLSLRVSPISFFSPWVKALTIVDFPTPELPSMKIKHKESLAQVSYAKYIFT